MPPKQHRLTTAAFNKYFKTGKRYRTPLLQLIYHPSSATQLAVVVGKKVAKTAVARNKLRRQIYNKLYRLVKERSSTGVYLVLLQPAASKASKAERLVTLEEVVGQVNKAR